MGKRQTNAPSASMHSIKQETRGRTWKPHSGERLYQCNQCDYFCSDPGILRIHLKRHSRDKSNKCNLCNFVSIWPANLKIHLKTHSGEKLDRCSQCGYASFGAGNPRNHLKTDNEERSNKCSQWRLIMEKRQTNAIRGNLHLIKQAIWGAIWKYAVEKS